jgi:hypothetical protein
VEELDSRGRGFGLRAAVLDIGGGVGGGAGGAMRRRGYRRSVDYCQWWWRCPWIELGFWDLGEIVRSQP